LIYHAIRHPNAVYTIESHQNHHAIVYQTARQDLLYLTKRGFLKKKKEGRTYIFTPNEQLIEKLGSKKTHSKV